MLNFISIYKRRRTKIWTDREAAFTPIIPILKLGLPLLYLISNIINYSSRPNNLPEL